MKKTAEKEESIKYLLKELGFKNVQYTYWSDSEYIDFTKQASIGNVAGILYCIRGNPTSHPYAKNIFDLGDDWYYYGSRRKQGDDSVMSLPHRSCKRRFNMAE